MFWPKYGERSLYFYVIIIVPNELCRRAKKWPIYAEVSTCDMQGGYSHKILQYSQYCYLQFIFTVSTTLKCVQVWLTRLESKVESVVIYHLKPCLLSVVKGRENIPPWVHRSRSRRVSKLP